LNTDWLKIPTQTSVGTHQSLRVDGGDDNLNYGFDMKYKNANGVMSGSGRQDYEVGLQVGARFKSFVFKNYLNYARVKATNSPYGSLTEYEKRNRRIRKTNRLI
jgi:hypothetical protein